MEGAPLIAWLGGIPIALLLVHQWGEEVSAAHRERYPSGFVERILAKKDTRPRRYLLTPFAATQLAASGIWATLKEIALRFDQFRSAFAFLFRRRLERRIEGQLDESQVESLPAVVQEAFTELPAERALQIDFFPELGEDVALAKRIVREALASSRYTYLKKPWTIVVNQVQLSNFVAVRLRAKVYVLDVRYETQIQTDVTERVLEAFDQAQVASPAVLHRAVA